MRRVEQHGAVPAESDAHQFVAEPQSGGVGESVGVVKTEAPRGNGGAEHVRAESHAFLLGPRGHDDRATGPQARLGEGTEDSQSAEDSEAAVEGASGGDGVDVRADENRGELGVLTFPAPEDRTHLIDRDVEVELLHPRNQQPTTGTVFVGQRLAVDADEAGHLIVVGADRGEFREVGPQAVSVDAEVCGGGVGGHSRVLSWKCAGGRFEPTVAHSCNR
nr:hypothetical protein [Brevibacterium oceani]